MRLFNAIKNDIKFQFKYGFYYLYIVISLVYIGLIHFVPNHYKNIFAAVIIFSDPVAFGMIFMGVIILFEKSENVFNFLFVTPLKIEEYILAKIISIAVISIFSSLTIVFFSLDISNLNMLLLLIAIVFGSFLSTLSGIIVASTVESINQFIVRLIPFGLFLSIPPAAILFGKDNLIIDLFPGNIVLELLLSSLGENKVHPIIIFPIIFWFLLFWKWSKIKIAMMLKNHGGSRNGKWKIFC